MNDGSYKSVFKLEIKYSGQLSVCTVIKQHTGAENVFCNRSVLAIIVDVLQT